MKIDSLDKSYKWFYWVIIMLVFTVLGVVIWSLNKGILFSDDAFYLFHNNPDNYIISVTNWHKVYKPFLLDNFIWDRYFITSLLAISAFFLGITASKYFQFSFPGWLIGLMCAGAQFILYAPVGFTPNYITINSVIFIALIIFFILHLQYNKRIYLYFSGFLFGVLPFVMITNSLYFLPLVLVLYMTGRDRFFQSLLIFSLGILSFFLLYFTIIERPQIFIEKFKEALDFMRFDEGHGIVGIINWHKGIIYHFLGGLLLLLYFLLTYGHQMNKYLKKGFITILILYAGYILYISLFNSYYIFYTTSFYLLSIWILSKIKISKVDPKIYLTLLFLITPYFAALGTDVNFFVRSAFYFPFLLLSIFALIYITGYYKIIKVLGILLFIVFINFMSLPFRGTWEGYKLVEQNKKFTTTSGTEIFLDQSRHDQLEELKPFLKNQENIIVSHYKLWGYVYLLDATPPFIYYRTNSYIKFYLDKNNIPGESLILLEKKDEPFEEGFLAEITRGEIKDFHKIDLKEFVIYSKKKL